MACQQLHLTCIRQEPSGGFGSGRVKSRDDHDNLSRPRIQEARNQRVVLAD